MNMETMVNPLEVAREILRSNLQLGARADQMDRNTALMGSLPEFNSLTVVGLIAGIEEQTGNTVNDDEISAEIFETVGTFADFVAIKMA
jgi:acyl carrier protein